MEQKGIRRREKVSGGKERAGENEEKEKAGMRARGGNGEEKKQYQELEDKQKQQDKKQQKKEELKEEKEQDKVTRKEAGRGEGGRAITQKPSQTCSNASTAFDAMSQLDVLVGPLLAVDAPVPPDKLRETVSICVQQTTCYSSSFFFYF